MLLALGLWKTPFNFLSLHFPSIPAYFHYILNFLNLRLPRFSHSPAAQKLKEKREEKREVRRGYRVSCSLQFFPHIFPLTLHRRWRERERRPSASCPNNPFSYPLNSLALNHSPSPRMKNPELVNGYLVSVSILLVSHEYWRKDWGRVQ